MTLLLYIFIIFLLVVLLPILFFGAWIVGKIIQVKRKVMGHSTNTSGFGGFSSGTYGSTSSFGGNGGKSTSSSRSHTTTSRSSSGNGKKIIPADEGEYVEFEEVK